MKSHSLPEIRDAAEAGEGFCLSCGTRQPFVERRWFLGLCVECDRPEVMSAESLERALRVVQLEWELD